jgi:hypothetical protein
METRCGFFEVRHQMLSSQGYYKQFNIPTVRSKTEFYVTPLLTAYDRSLLTILPSSLPNTLPSIQSTFTRRTSEHCLWNFTKELSFFPSFKCIFYLYAVRSI